MRYLDSCFTAYIFIMSLVPVLCAYRTSQALAQKLPAYCIFGNSQISDIAKNQPQSMSELRLIKGMGPERTAKYGRDILDLIKESMLMTPPPVITMKHNGNERGSLRRPKLAKFKKATAPIATTGSGRCLRVLQGPSQM